MPDFKGQQFTRFNCVRRRALFASVCALLFPMALSLACNNVPSGKAVGDIKTPSGTTPPRTALPMPPVTGSGAKATAQSFTMLDDRPATLADYQGKILVLDFWATFCQPCREAAPHLSALQKEFGDRGVVVVGLNVGGPEDRPRIPAFIEDLRIEYALGVPEPEMTNFFLGTDNQIPQTIVFDRAGRILKHFVGYDSTVSAELDRTIQDALATK
jgi:thiol-disulfide isomerase/thioredoxin